MLLRKAFHNTPHFLICVLHATTDTEYICSPANSAVQPLSSHTGSCNKCFRRVHHTMSTRSHSSGKTCSFRESFHILPLHFPASGAVKLSPELCLMFCTKKCVRKRRNSLLFRLSISARTNTLSVSIYFPRWSHVRLLFI